MFKFFAPAERSRIRLTPRGKAKGCVKVYANDALAATVPVESSKEWAEFDAAFTGENEKMRLRFVYEGKGAVDYKAFELI